LTVSGVISSTGAFGLTKIGSGKAALSANNSYTGTTTVTNGTLLVNGNPTGGGAYVVDAGGTLGGIGTISASITNNGTIAPGASVGTLTTTLGNNVTMGANSHLAIELSGATADKLVVGGHLNLSALDFLDVTGVGTGTSWIIASYASLTGTFNNVTSGAADYVVWRKTMPGNLIKYQEWRANFGNPPGSGSGLGGDAGSVPEPASALLLLFAMAAVVGLRRSR
jgi:autotransporter-associated beta strand protein